MKKIGRNDNCSCGSSKKYKQCCFMKDIDSKLKEQEKYSLGQSESSENVQACLQFLKNTYSDHKVIDISNDLEDQNYKLYQIKNYTNKIIMVAERNLKNDNVFKSRVQTSDNMIVLYRGSYRIFNHLNINQVKESIHKMIMTRLAGKDDV
jgi:SEC-C motif